MYVEVYLDTSKLSSNQSLVIVDESGRQHDATEALRELNNSNPGRSRRRDQAHVVLERWKVGLQAGPMEDSYDYGATLPTVYKRCITFFRALYASTGMLPASKLVRSIGKSPATRSILKVKCRVINGGTHTPPDDPLTMSLFSSDSDVTSSFGFGETETPAGSFIADVTYRNECNFRVESSETLLSERFMGDEDVFKPTLAPRHRRGESQTEVGSLPVHHRHSSETSGMQTYGSLSTFHGDAPPLGPSPISALRAARNMGSDTSSPPIDSLPERRPGTSQRPSSIALDSITMARRPSLSFNPFKAGSLSGSPLPGTSVPQSSSIPHRSASPQSYSRTPGSASNQARNRSSLTAGMPSSLRGAPLPQDNAGPSSASSSPRPAPVSKYSSSFSHRRGRLSYGGASRADDEGSSGKQSVSSSLQPGSGVFPEASGSSGSLPVDDDNISDFLKGLNIDKNLPSFHKPKASEASKQTPIKKFQSLRENHNALAESLSSSMLLQRSSSTSSRQIGSLPPMVGGMSISSSPGKPNSPHTPHTPAIPSRLSANSIADYSPRFRARAVTAAAAMPTGQEETVEEESNAGAAPMNIPLPTSPRLYQYGSHNRRSSSVAQQQRILAAVEDDGPYRSMSVGAEDREPPSLTDLRGFGQISGSLRIDRVLQPAAEITGAAASMPRASPAMQRLGASTRGGMASRTGSTSSVVTGSGSERDRANRYSFQRQQLPQDEGDDEYPFLFDMSELGRNSEQGRRSLEEGRGGGDSGSSARRGGRWLGN